MNSSRWPATWPSATARETQGPQKPAPLLYQPQRDRITIGLAVVRRQRCNDDEEQIEQADDPDQKEADQHDHQHDAHDRRNRHRDLEIQRLLALVVDERHLVLLDLPDDQRTDDRAERNDETD